MHYVVTIENAITIGRHLYPSACSQDTAFGIIHTFVLNYMITNTLHDDLYTMLRRIMAMWHLNYDEDPFFHGHGNPHVPDITTTTGLMDVMAIGNLLELAHVIDRRAYKKEIHWTEQPEMGIARWSYRKLQVFFAKRYVTMVGEKSVSPLSVFRRSLVEFAAAVMVYKRSVNGMNIPKVEGCTRYQMEKKMLALFESNYPELVPTLHGLVEQEWQFLYWTGPAITIRPRDKGDRMRRTKKIERIKYIRQLDFDDRAIFLPVDKDEAADDKDEDEDVDEVEDEEATEGVDTMPRRSVRQQNALPQLQKDLKRRHDDDHGAERPKRARKKSGKQDDLYIKTILVLMCSW